MRILLTWISIFSIIDEMKSNRKHFICKYQHVYDNMKKNMLERLNQRGKGNMLGITVGDILY